MIVLAIIIPEIVTIIGVFFTILSGKMGGIINNQFERVHPTIIVPKANRDKG